MTLAGAAPILLALAKTGLARAGTSIFQKLLRLRGLDKTLRAGSFTSPALEKSINDLEIVLGSYRGILDEPLSHLIAELQKSGIITIMAEEAILQRDTDTTSIRFLELYKQFLELYKQIVGGDEENGRDLHKTVKLALASSITALFGNDAQALVIQTFGKTLAAKLDRIEAARLRPAMTMDIPLEELTNLLLRLARSLQTIYRSIRIETNKGPKSLAINDIYTPARLLHRARQELDLKAFISEGGVNLRDDSQSEAQGFAFTEFRDTFSRAVVLGDPGGGKSTLCQFICFEMARQSLLAAQTNDKRISNQMQRMPLRIVLRLYESARAAEPQLSLFEYCAREIVQAISAPIEVCRELLSYLLTYGRAMLAFDGLDEILNTGRRREFVDIVLSFIEQFPLCPVLVTSRLVGYENAPLSDDFDEFILVPFSTTEVKHYLNRFFAKVVGHNKEERAIHARRFIEQTENNARDLRANPLMLGLMAFLFSAKGDVPANRPEIYRECATLMFEKWDQNRGIRSDIPVDFDLIDLFSHIASRVYGNPDLEVGVSKEWLFGELVAYFRTQYVESGKAYNAAKTVLEFVTGRAWVMSDVGSDVYSFTHRTFLEFFYARQMEQKCDTVGELFGALVPHIRREEWDVVCHLALQIKTHRNQPRTAQAAEILRETVVGAEGGGTEDLAILVFAARSLEYLLATEQAMSELIAAILGGIFGRSGELDRRALQAVYACCNVCNERREYVHSVISSLCVNRFVKPINGSDIDVAELITPRDGRHRSVFADQEDSPVPLNRLWKDDAIRQSVFKRSQTCAFYVLLSWEWYREFAAEQFRLHGFGIFFSERRPSKKEDLGEILIDIVSEALGSRGRGDPDIPKTARRALKIISREVDERMFTVLQGKALNPPYSPESWYDSFTRAHSERDTFLGALTIYAVHLELMKGTDDTRRFLKNYGWLGGRLLARIDRSIEHHQCEAHPTVRFMRKWRAENLALLHHEKADS